MLDIRLMMMADHAGVAALFMEMQQYYRVWCPPRETILTDLAKLPPGTEIFVVDNGHLIGFAAFSAIYPGPGLASGLFLKELFVSQAHRGGGIGRLLMKRLAALAVERGYRRIDWTADRENTGLLSFYDDLGAARKEEKLFYRLDKDALRELAED
ncbi:acetyltransferase [Paramesorhizobium deserti]|uniref:Acetyltransferase n=1 Tax=Paramesorhizobium deserti TaxID=1494590 RepID=A0A135HPC5_9HYPH|nr:GNAT family N-acetyltransferase [Paramesorhizobium deserti]KXF75062.1 acetyltransferase [Paramesorhizobium deserti]